MAMKDKFSIGERCILLYSPEWPEKPTCEVIITGRARRFRPCSGADGKFAWRDYFSHQYALIDESGENWTATESELRKIPPKQDWEKLCALEDLEAVS